MSESTLPVVLAFAVLVCGSAFSVIAGCTLMPEWKGTTTLTLQDGSTLRCERYKEWLSDQTWLECHRR